MAVSKARRLAQLQAAKRSLRARETDKSKRTGKRVFFKKRGESAAKTDVRKKRFARQTAVKKAGRAKRLAGVRAGLKTTRGKIGGIRKKVATRTAAKSRRVAAPAGRRPRAAARRTGTAAPKRKIVMRKRAPSTGGISPATSRKRRELAKQKTLARRRIQ